jgi:hypothetical protein
MRAEGADQRMKARGAHTNLSRACADKQLGECLCVRACACACACIMESMSADECDNCSAGRVQAGR